MGSSLPYDDTHDNQKVIVDCDVCDQMFEQYPDKVSTCTNCLTNSGIRRQRQRLRTSVAYLFGD